MKNKLNNGVIPSPINNVNPDNYTIDNRVYLPLGCDLSFEENIADNNDFCSGFKIYNNTHNWSFKHHSDGCGRTVRGIHILHIIAYKDPTGKAANKSSLPQVSPSVRTNVHNIKIFIEEANESYTLASTLLRTHQPIPMGNRILTFDGTPPKPPQKKNGTKPLPNC